MNSTYPIVSIICPTYKEERFIGSCIESILLQDYPQDKLEFLIIDGRSPDATREIVNNYAARHPWIKLLDNPQQVVPFALNIGIEQSMGEVILRIDAHCTYPNNYISRLVDVLYQLKADNVGGVWHTKPANKSSEAMAVAEVCSNSFGVGNSHHKVGIKEITSVDTVPFGCFPRSVFDRIGLFDEDLIRNQDDEFNARIIKNGGKIYIIPDLEIEYSARPSFKKMSKMYYQYGLFKPLVNVKLKQAASLRQFVPVAFVAGLFLGAGLSFLFYWCWIAYGIIVVLYLLLALFQAFKYYRKTKNIATASLLPLGFFLAHFSYGWGYWMGIGKLLFRRKIQVAINR
ncbi:glycosyltransferase family 2 protein [Porphyromonas endodontalis]|uniref:glycosyltransferase family 2 protein n=1 Tax=Porphyromonas endodontalis TaxID=28124 RepID=UPI0028ED9ECC|nr:glycosyltransferase family 2 protein [Porphyromonas endodontalis]